MYTIRLIVYTYSTVFWCVFFTEPCSIGTTESHKVDKAQQTTAILSVVHKPFSAVMRYLKLKFSARLCIYFEVIQLLALREFKLKQFSWLVLHLN